MQYHLYILANNEYRSTNSGNSVYRAKPNSSGGIRERIRTTIYVKPRRRINHGRVYLGDIDNASRIIILKDQTLTLKVWF
jgi:hypothetical protein